MKRNTNLVQKLPARIKRLLREEGRLAAIARRAKRADGSRGVSRSMVSHVLAGRKQSPRVEYAILREAVRLERSRAYRALGRAEGVGRRFESEIRNLIRASATDLKFEIGDFK